MFVTARLTYAIDLSGSLSSQTVEELLLDRGSGAWGGTIIGFSGFV